METRPPGSVVGEIESKFADKLSASISDEYLIEKLQAELEATHQRVFFDRGAKGEESKVVYSDELIDWQTRQKARQDAHRLRGDYPAEKYDVGGSVATALSEYVEALEKASAIAARVTEPAGRPD